MDDAWTWHTRVDKRRVSVHKTPRTGVRQQKLFQVGGLPSHGFLGAHNHDAKSSKAVPCDHSTMTALRANATSVCGGVFHAARNRA